VSIETYVAIMSCIFRRILYLESAQLYYFCTYPLGLSLLDLCSNIVLLFYSGILPCYCYYSHASLANMLKFHN